MPVVSHLRERQHSEDWLTVEFGHRNLPIHKMMRNLSGKRSYIGLETWQRDIGGEKEAFYRRLGLDTVTKNSFFLDAPRINLDANAEPVTLLPAGIADEVFAANLVSDPQISEYGVELFLREATRLAKIGGLIVMAETITPELDISA